MTERSIEEILALAEDSAYHRVATAKITAAPQALRDEHAELTALLPTLVSDTIDDHPDLMSTAERLVAIEEQIEASTIEFRFRCVGHRAWADLLAQHPPTRAQLKQDRTLDHNPETFPFEAMAASCIDPVMTAEDVARLADSPLLDVQSWSALWNACIKANVSAPAPKAVAAHGLIHRRNGASELPPPPTG